MEVLLAFLLWKDILPRLLDALLHFLAEPVSVSKEKGFSLLPSKIQFLSWAFGGQRPGAAGDLLAGVCAQVVSFISTQTEGFQQKSPSSASTQAAGGRGW